MSDNLTVATLIATLSSMDPEATVVLACESDSSVRYSHPARTVFAATFGESLVVLYGGSGWQAKDLPGYVEPAYDDDAHGFDSLSSALADQPCDICDYVDDGIGDDWNGLTGNHITCERR